ncbi:hypothetical protein A3A54_01380 [Candidatus Curtissbacteria bacterium RIFCSPLOWO2_01_FULL_39_62]|uniref:Uncharacterized protein n=2 Tax=Candidatus Curtissiibacteriota TaxID=1752717 RepID=A0A1F5G6Z6_9BACT|nr:MAG: hypothetical protein A2775_00305 [Candidatus Curtissbacteria bacterium RIFCSPHIGHO2_01_FULL_39_57]OGD87650.1 MAG: hypothetical protein A3D04_02155 [Candidatus Curtissbacteria bacterium RIFCSPHIGHO2_02_FULL_40_16b]OGD90132.1 MAG: hypothetical protein A3E11_00025 [Candidatus Curtissbacteria bacterium RIFCSPHIGHO2_12_FULL_38_37]OGE00447.1 MAG: hypothetical protein A3A54_01380 [Candidatus Curtissbacteria bacterium RIFCSPLOWO2_01_FULL_39_62]OGE01031.1 MAG: hypothetical protein A3J17_03525 [C
MTSVRTFKVPNKYLSLLTASEKKMLPHLIEAVKGVDKIYQLQENNINNGANFYPRDAIKTEIEKAAKKNPKILSPFTIVKRNSKSQLVVNEYHKEYQKLLKPISINLKRAAKICKNKSFKKYLETLANALIDGSYKKADIAWLKVKNTHLDIVIGPYERYLDKLFFKKMAYQGCVGITDIERTQRGREIRDILYTTFGDKPHRVISPSIVDIQVKVTFIISGFLGRAVFTQQHLPSDSETIETHGSKIIGYLSSIDYKFEKLIYPIFNNVFEKNFRTRYKKDSIKNGNYYVILLTGIVQQLHRYKGSRERLKELFPIFDEANTVVSGIQHAKHLVLKGVIGQKELESMMVAQLCWMFSEVINTRKLSTREVYLKGDSLVYNFLLEVGALRVHEGISWPNFAKMFFEMENLASIFTRILEEGTYKEASDFLDKYFSLEPLKTFNSKLAVIKPI